MKRTKVLLIRALCLYCGKVLKTTEGLEAHQRARHFRCTDSNCPRRGQRFKTFTALQTHCLRVHPDRPLTRILNAYRICSSLSIAQLIELSSSIDLSANDLYSHILAFHHAKLKARYPRHRITLDLPPHKPAPVI